MKYIDVSSAGKARVEFAIAIMEATTPDWHSWFEKVIHTISIDPAQCTIPNTIACTWVPKYGPGVIVFPTDPKDIPAASLARTLRHEAHHYGLGWGGLVRVLHTCSDPGCQEPSERACDPIYKSDSYFGPRYQTRYDSIMEEVRKQGGQKRATATTDSISFGDFLKGAGIAAAFMVALRLLLKVA